MALSPSPPQMSPIHLDASPDMFQPTTPGAYALNLIDGIAFSPSPPQQSQMDEWLRSLSPLHSDASPDMFQPAAPEAYALNVIGGMALSPISPSMLNIVRLNSLNMTYSFSGGY